MTPPTSRIAGIALGLAAGLVPLVYFPDILPPIAGHRILGSLFPPLFEFALLPRLLLLQVLLAVVLVARGVSAIAARPRALDGSPLLLPIFCYAAVSVASVFWAVNPVEALVQAGRLTTYLVLFLVAAHCITPGAIKGICAAGAATGAAVSVIGIAQYFGWGFADIPTVGNPGATFGYRNLAASYLVVSIPVAVAFGWTSNRRSGQILWALSAVLMSLFLVYTRTRGAWLGLGGALLAGTVALAWLRWRHGADPIGLGRSRPRLYIAAAGVLLLLVCGPLQHRMQVEGAFRFDERKTDALTALTKSFSPTDARGRLTMARHTLEMIRDNPILGVGIGNWQYIYPEYDRGDWIKPHAAPQRPHNDLLWILSETGVVGLLAYLWIIVTLVALVWRALREAPNSTRSLWMLGFALGILALLGHGLFSFPRERVEPSMAMWMGLGFVARLAAEGGRSQGVARCSRLAISCVLLLGGLVLACAISVTYRQIRFDAHYVQAVELWRRSDWPSLVSQTEHALGWGPLNYRAYLLNGLAHYQMGNPEAAIRSYSTSLRYHPNEGHAALAAAFVELGDHREAAVHYRRELDLYPRSADAALGLASSLAAVQDWEGAATAYRQALQIDQENPRLYNNLGAALAQLGCSDEAERAYLSAIQIRPDYARAHHNLGDLYTSTGDKSAALRAYTRFIETWQGDPRHIELARKKIQGLGMLER